MSVIDNLKQDVYNEINNAIDTHGDSNWYIIYEEMYEQLYMDQGGEFIGGFIDLIDETYENFKRSYEATQRILENV